MRLEDIRNIGVIGAGTMGHGIALTYALGGYNVTMMDIREAALNNAIHHISNDLQTFVDNSVIYQNEVEKTLLRIRTTNKIDEVAKDADFITETIVEDAEAKRRVFDVLDNLCRQHTIFASNTSSLVISDFAQQCKRKDKILITHWMNPPHIVPAVEIARSVETSDETVDVIYALLKKVKKVPVRVMKQIPGLVINRLQAALFREVISLWQQGVASPEDIDLAVKGSFGFRLAAIGPLETCDLGGLDIWQKVAHNLFPVISDTHAPPEEFDRLVNNGNLGLKTGKGFFDYSVSYFGEGQDERIKSRDQKFIALLKLLYS